MKNLSFRHFALAIFTLLFVEIAFAQNSCSKNVSNKMNVTNFNMYMPNAKVDDGYFMLDNSDDLMCIKMSDAKYRDEQHYMIGNCFEAAEISGSRDGQSTITRRSGELSFDNLNNKRGTFKFKKNPSFVNFLNKEGIALDNDPYYFKLYLGDIEESYVLNIKRLGFQPTITELGRLVWHDASIDYIKSMHQLFPEYSLNDISLMSAHHISVDDVKGYESLGLKEVNPHSIKKAKMKGITPEMIRAQQRNGYRYDNLHSYINMLKNKKKHKNKCN